MTTPDLFRARLAHLIDPRHPLAVLATRMPWAQLEAAMAPLLARTTTSAEGVPTIDLFGAAPVVAGFGIKDAASAAAMAADADGVVVGSALVAAMADAASADEAAARAQAFLAPLRQALGASL